MKQKWSWVFLIFVGCVFSFVGAQQGNAKAETAAQILLHTKQKEIQKGENFTVTLTVQSKEAMGRIEGFLTYDADRLTFLSEKTKTITGGKGVLRLDTKEFEKDQIKKVYQMRWKAKKTGKSSICLKSPFAIYSYGSEDQIAFSARALQVEIQPAIMQKKENRLSALYTYPGKLEPEFLPDQFLYHTIVEETVDTIVVSAIPKDKKAIVHVSGNEKLKKGKNHVNIVVEAQSGDKKTYQIIVEKGKQSKAGIWLLIVAGIAFYFLWLRRQKEKK